MRNGGWWPIRRSPFWNASKVHLNRHGWMDQQERDNWQRVLDSLEAAGDTESAFYVRARAICNGDPDPMLEWEANS